MQSFAEGFQGVWVARVFLWKVALCLSKAGSAQPRAAPSRLGTALGSVGWLQLVPGQSVSQLLLEAFWETQCFQAPLKVACSKSCLIEAVGSEVSSLPAFCQRKQERICLLELGFAEWLTEAFEFHHHHPLFFLIF